MKDRLRTSTMKELTGKVINGALALTLVSGCMMPATAWAEVSQSSDVVAGQIATESQETQWVDIADMWEQGELVLDHGGNYYLSRSFATSGTLVLAVPEGEALNLDFCGHEVIVEGVVSSGIDVSQSRGVVRIADGVFDQSAENDRGALSVVAHAAQQDVFGVHGNFDDGSSPSVSLSDIEVDVDVATVDASIESKSNSVNATAVFFGSTDEQGEPAQLDATLCDVSLGARLSAREFSAEQIELLVDAGERPLSADSIGAACGLYVHAHGVVLDGSLEMDVASEGDMPAFGIYSAVERPVDLGSLFEPQGEIGLCVNGNNPGSVVAGIADESSFDGMKDHLALTASDGLIEVSEGKIVVADAEEVVQEDAATRSVAAEAASGGEAASEDVPVVPAALDAIVASVTSAVAGAQQISDTALARSAEVDTDAAAVIYSSSGSPVASFDTLQEAFSAAENGQTIKVNDNLPLQRIDEVLSDPWALGADVYLPERLTLENGSLSSSDSITVDLCGHVIPQVKMSTGGQVTFCNGIIEVEDYYANPDSHEVRFAVLADRGSLTLEGMEIRARLEAGVEGLYSLILGEDVVQPESVAAVCAQGDASVRLSDTAVRLNTMTGCSFWVGSEWGLPDGVPTYGVLARDDAELIVENSSSVEVFCDQELLSSATVQGLNGSPGEFVDQKTNISAVGVTDNAQCVVEDASLKNAIDRFAAGYHGSMFACEDDATLSLGGEVGLDCVDDDSFVHAVVAANPLSIKEGLSLSLTGVPVFRLSTSLRDGEDAPLLRFASEDEAQQALQAGQYDLGISGNGYIGGTLVCFGNELRAHVDYVAAVGGESFVSLESALDAANEGDTITLLDGALIANTALAFDKSVTLDLAGASVQLANNGSAPAITVKSGTLTLMNSKPGEGSIQWTDSTLSSSSDPAQAAHAMQVDAGAKLVIDDAALDIHSTGGGKVVSAVVNAGSVELLHGADISLTCENGGGSTAYGVYEVGAATLNVAEDASVTVSTAAKPTTSIHADLDSTNAGSAEFTADMIVGKLDPLTNSARYQRILQAFAERGDLVTYDATSQLYYTKSYIKVDNKLAYVFMSQQGMDQLSNGETVGLDECLVLVVMPYVSSEVSAVGVGAAADATGAVTIAGTVEAGAASGSATAVKASGAAESAWCLNGASLVANASPSTYPVRGNRNLSTALPQLLGKTAEELVNVLPTTATGAVGNAGTHLSDFSIIVDKAPQAIAAERTGAASLQLDGALSSHLTGADALHLKADLATVGSSALWPSGTVNGTDTAGWLCANQQGAIEAGKAFLAPGGNALTPAPVTAPMAGRFHAFDGSAAAVATSVAGLTGYALWGEGCTVEFRDASGAVLSRLENVTPGSEVALPDAALDALKKPGDAMGSNVLGGWSAKPDSKPTDSGVTSVDAGVVTAPAEAGATLVLYPSYAYVPISYTMTFKDAAGKALGTLDAGANVALDQASSWYKLKSELDNYVAENPSVVGWQLADGTIVATDYLAQYKPQQDGLELTAFSLTTNAGQGRLVYLVKDYDGNWKAFFNKAVNTGMEVTYNGRSDINTNFAVQVSATKTGSFTDFEPFKNWSSEYFTPEGDHVKLAQWKDVAAGGSFKVNEPIKVTDGLRYLEAVYDTHATDLETEVVYKYNYNGTVADRTVSSLTSGIGPVVAKLGTSLADALQNDDGPAPLTGYLAQDDQGQWLAYTLTGWRYGSYNQSSTAGGMVYKDASQIKLLPASSQQADPWGWKCTIDLVNDRDLRHEGRGILAVYQAAPAKLVVHWGANDAYGAASEAAWDTSFYDLRDEFEPASVPVPAGMRLKGWTMQGGDGLALGGNAVLFERAKDLVAAVGSNKTSVEVTLLPVFEAIPVDETAALRAAQNEAMKTFSMVQLAYSTMSFAYTDDQKLFLQNALDNFSDVVSMCTSTAEVDYALSTWVGLLQAQHEQAWESYLASQGGNQGGTQGGNQGGTTTPGDQPSGDMSTVPSTGNPSGDAADNGADDGDKGDDGADKDDGNKSDADKDSKGDSSSNTGTSGNKTNGTASGTKTGTTNYGNTSFSTPVASGSTSSTGANGSPTTGLGAVSSANPNDSAELADSTAYRLMGCELETLTPELAEQYGLASTEGVLVTTVEPDSAAARAGLQAGDVVKAVNGKPVTTAEELEEALAGLAEGDDVALDIERGGESLALGVTLAPTPGTEGITDDDTALAEGMNLAQQPGEESGGIIAWMVDHLVVLLLGVLLVLIAAAAVLWRVLTRRNADETEGLDGDLWDAGMGMNA